MKALPIFHTKRCRIFKMLPAMILSGFAYVCAAQTVALKNNALMDALLIPNLGLEVKTSSHTTLAIEGSYVPYTFSDNRKWKHWLVQPEFRLWLRTPFSGEFIAINGMAGEFNIARVPFFHLQEKRVEGKLYGGGLTFGKHFILSPHWGIEASLSLGFMYLDYSRHKCSKCGLKEKTEQSNYIGPTRAAVSLVYMIN